MHSCMACYERLEYRATGKLILFRAYDRRENWIEQRTFNITVCIIFERQRFWIHRGQPHVAHILVWVLQVHLFLRWKLLSVLTGGSSISDQVHIQLVLFTAQRQWLVKTRVCTASHVSCYSSQTKFVLHRIFLLLVLDYLSQQIPITLCSRSTLV